MISAATSPRHDLRLVEPSLADALSAEQRRPMRFRRLWRTANPLYPALLSWVVTIGNFGIGDRLFHDFGWNNITSELVGSLVLAAAITPVIALFVLATTYDFNSKTIGRIISLYLALIILFSNINFWMMVHFSRGGTAPFQGIHNVWGDTTGMHHGFLWSNALLAIVDCFHFSVTTLSTVGYGEIYATAWYSKLAVDVEILLGLGVTIVTVGRHFSREPGAGSRIAD